MVGHGADKLFELEATRCSSTLQALSQRLFEIERENGLLRADRLLLLPGPAHVVDMPWPMLTSKAGGQQAATVPARDQTLERGFDRTVLSDFGTTQFVLGVDLVP